MTKPERLHIIIPLISCLCLVVLFDGFHDAEFVCRWRRRDAYFFASIMPSLMPTVLVLCSLFGFVFS